MDDPVTNFTLSYLPGGAINYTYVDDPELNALIEEASATFDEEEKIEIMREAAKIVHEQVYDNVMYTQNLYVAHSSDWEGFISKPSELLSIVNPVSIASAHKVRSEEHTSELQSLMRISYAVFCLKKKNSNRNNTTKS